MIRTPARRLLAGGEPRDWSTHSRTLRIVIGMVLPRQENIMRLARYPWTLISLVALLPGCLPSCDPTPPPDDTPPPEPSPPDACAAPGACAVPGAGTVLTRSQLTHNDLHHNSLKASALAKNTYLRTQLAKNPLNDETFRALRASTAPESSAFMRELNDHETRTSTMELMEYVVSCALPLDPEATVGEPFDETWKGELGLCADWAHLAPGPKCLELVSSCVLSRVNARYRKVIISMRGEPNGLFPLQTQVPVEQDLREKSGTRIRSFRSLDECAGEPFPKDPAARDCGFQPLYVGVCKAGEPVTVCTGGDDCSCEAVVPDDDKRVSLRVCKGLYGCDSGPFDPTKYDDWSDPDPEYTGWLADSQYTCPQNQTRPTVTFTCPTNGPLIDRSDLTDGERYGYYSVMIGPGYAPLSTTLADVGTHVVATAGNYPASEAEVFTYREGAFYGNLFSDAQVADKDPRELSGDAYACFGKEWSDGLATMTDRFCAGTDECFHHAPTPCFHSWTSGDAHCMSDLGMPGDFYQNCDDRPAGLHTWSAPITVYLNHPCDLVDPKACNIGKVPSVPPQLSGAPPKQ
jgi:hypothetical protein